MSETAASGYSQVPQKGREVEMTAPGKEAEDGVVPAASGNEDAICLKPKMSLLNGITVCIVATVFTNLTHFLIITLLVVLCCYSGHCRFNHRFRHFCLSKRRS